MTEKGMADFGPGENALLGDLSIEEMQQLYVNKYMLQINPEQDSRSEKSLKKK